MEGLTYLQVWGLCIRQWITILNLCSGAWTMLVGGFFHLIIICITTIRDNINTSATNLWGGRGVCLYHNVPSSTSDNFLDSQTAPIPDLGIYLNKILKLKLTAIYSFLHKFMRFEGFFYRCRASVEP